MPPWASDRTLIEFPVGVRVHATPIRANFSEILPNFHHAPYIQLTGESRSCQVFGPGFVRREVGDRGGCVRPLSREDMPCICGSYIHQCRAG